MKLSFLLQTMLVFLAQGIQFRELRDKGKKNLSQIEQNELAQWRLQKAILLATTQAQVSALLKGTSLTQDQQKQVKKSTKQVFEYSASLYESLNQTQKEQLKNFLISAPVKLQQLSKNDRQVVTHNIIYFSNQTKIRQQQLLTYMSFNVSEMINNDKDNKTFQEFERVLKRVDIILKEDEAHPNQTYIVPEQWNYKNYNQTQKTDLNAILDDQMIKDTLANYTQSNQTINDALEAYLKQLNQTELNTQDKEGIKQAFDQLNKTIQEALEQQKHFNESTQTDFKGSMNSNRTNKTMSAEQSEQSNAKTLRDNEIMQQQKWYQRYTIIFQITFLVMIVLGVGYFIKRRNDVLRRVVRNQTESQQFEDARQ